MPVTYLVCSSGAVQEYIHVYSLVANLTTATATSGRLCRTGGARRGSRAAAVGAGAAYVRRERAVGVETPLESCVHIAVLVDDDVDRILHDSDLPLATHHGRNSQEARHRRRWCLWKGPARRHRRPRVVLTPFQTCLLIVFSKGTFPEVRIPVSTRRFSIPDTHVCLGLCADRVRELRRRRRG